MKEAALAHDRTVLPLASVAAGRGLLLRCHSLDF